MSKSEIVLQSLRENAESFEKIDGVEWGWVYLDNARPSTMNLREIRSCLSALSRRGLYKPWAERGAAFGSVRMTDPV